MILEEATFKKFGYCPSELKPKSNKLLIAKCDDCGKVRKITKRCYHPLCRSCATKGNTKTRQYKHTEASKAKMRARMIGNINALGCQRSEKTRALMSAGMKGKNVGEDAYNYKGGKILARARTQAKRRQLGSNFLIPLEEGEAGHHVTNEDIIGVPVDVHQKLAGGGREKHRAKTLNWLKDNDRKKHDLVVSVLDNNPYPTTLQSGQNRKVYIPLYPIVLLMSVRKNGQ